MGTFLITNLCDRLYFMCRAMGKRKNVMEAVRDDREASNDYEGRIGRHQSRHTTRKR